MAKRTVRKNTGIDNTEKSENISYNPYRDFTTLNAWKKVRKVKLFFYEIILPTIPDTEKYSLGHQIRKAAISSTANIAEGYGRFHYQEGIQFYRISRASLYEFKDHLISFLDFDFITKEDFNQGLSLIEDSKITINGYLGFVKKQKDNY